MGFVESLGGLFRRKKKPVLPGAMLTDRQRVRKMIIEEAMAASDMAAFLSIALNSGRSAKITVEVDGFLCPVGILCGAAEPLMEYLANWACAKSLEKRDRLDQFDRQDRGGAANPGDLSGEGGMPA